VGLVACAVVIALAAGGAGVIGGLGGLLGRDGSSLEVAKAPTPAADIVAAPIASTRLATARALAPTAAPRRRSTRTPPSAPQHRPSTTPAPGNSIPPAAPAPQAPAPQLPPTPAPPAPAPGNGQAVSALGQAVKDLVAQAPPQAQPLTKPIADAVDTLVATCRGLPVCP
jgi:hypothetical protein